MARKETVLPFFFHPVSAANMFTRINKYSVSPGNFLGSKQKNVQIALVHFSTRLATIQSTFWKNLSYRTVIKAIFG